MIYQRGRCIRDFTWRSFGGAKQSNRQASEQVACQKRSVRERELTSTEQFSPLLRSSFGGQYHSAVAPVVNFITAGRVKSHRTHERAAFVGSHECADAICLRTGSLDSFV